MAKFLSGRQRNLNLGITSFTESKTVLQTTGKVGIGTTDAQQSALYVLGSTNLSGDLNVGGTVNAPDISVTNLTVSGLSAFNDATVFNDTIDVEGHTELNTLNVVGVSTFTSDSTVIQVISGRVGIGTTVSKTPIQIDSYGISTGIGTFIASSGITTDIDSFVISESDFKMLEYTIHVQNGSRFQAQKVLLMQDNSTAYSQEYAIMYEPDLIVSVGSTISSGVCKLQVTPETGISGLTTYRFSRGSIF